MSKAKLSTEAKAWILYDGGNSAFATTVIAAFFLYFSMIFGPLGLKLKSKPHILVGA